MLISTLFTIFSTLIREMLIWSFQTCFNSLNIGQIWCVYIKKSVWAITYPLIRALGGWEGRNDIIFIPLFYMLKRSILSKIRRKKQLRWYHFSGLLSFFFLTSGVKTLFFFFFFPGNISLLSVQAICLHFSCDL